MMRLTCHGIGHMCVYVSSFFSASFAYRLKEVTQVRRILFVFLINIKCLATGKSSNSSSPTAC